MNRSAFGFWRQTGNASNLAFNVDLAKRNVFGRVKGAASLLRQDLYLVVAPFEQILATMVADERACSLVRLKCEFIRNELQVNAWPVTVSLVSKYA